MMTRIYLHICRQLLRAGVILLLGVGSAWAVEVVLVAHPDVEIDSLTVKDVQLIYFGKRTIWQDGTLIVPLMQVESTVTDTFIDDLLDLTPQQFYLYWRKALFTGQGIPPQELSGDEEMKQRILETPGSIGYVAKEALDSDTRVIPQQ